MSVIVEKASGHTDKVIISNQGQIMPIDVQERIFNFLLIPYSAYISRV